MLIIILVLVALLMYSFWKVLTSKLLDEQLKKWVYFTVALSVLLVCAVFSYGNQIGYKSASTQKIVAESRIDD